MRSILMDAELKREMDAIVEAILYLYTESRRLTKGMASGFGLTGPQLTVTKLLESMGDLSLSSLSGRIRAKNSTVSGIIDRMESGGLVERVRSDSDKRVTWIRLTSAGRKLAKQIRVEPMEIFREAVQSLSREELRELFRLLKKLETVVRARVEASN